MTPKTTPAAPVATVDQQNPWLGLVSFTEETRSYFHGREEEAAELSRRVQRKLLTVLFGQSGLGKTSILQAGLVPRLRPEGFCPVYVRLDYDPNSPSPAEQIKRAVFKATEAAGTWTRSGTAVAGETLWEFLHHRDDVLKDHAGRTLIPILIFDQFEEIFTLAQSDDAGRKRAQEFLADLADLVENRPPAALEARIDRDETDAAKFDFARADYRVLISLREDYLAHLEGLKDRMPSVTQNRMRLARMTGPQAVAAVRAPAPHLVSETVAEAVVRFVAGGADLARAEVEPSLLSLICRELNNARLAKGEAEISADLLAGSRDTILSEFYARALAGQPSGVQMFIEAVMLTDSGFRESVAEERVRKGFAAAGAAEGTLALLVDRRLLRVEDRLDLRRVEITHDVLCSVISASRSVRREREALEESRRQLAAQQERERATRQALTRARRVAAVAVGIMLAAVAGAIFGYVNLRRARAAEAEAARSKVLAEQARSQAEKLVGFLSEDFAEELRPTGRVEVLAKLADKAVAYYDGLPPEMVTRQTQIYRGLALGRKAAALNMAGKNAESNVAVAAARKIFVDLRAAGDVSDETATGLAFVDFASARVGVGRLETDSLEEGVALLRPIVAAGRATRSTKLTFADLLQYLAHAEANPAVGVKHCEEARAVLAEIGALDGSDLTAAAIYGDVTDSQSRMVIQLGQIDEAERLAKTVIEIAEKVLEQRPADLRAMQNRYYGANMLGTVALDRNDLAKAEIYNAKAIEAARSYTYFNPADSTGWNLLTTSGRDLASTYIEQGRIAEGQKLLRETVALEHDPRNKTGADNGTFFALRLLEAASVQAGDLRGARAALDEIRRVGPAIVRERALGQSWATITSLMTQIFEHDLDAAQADYAPVLARAQEIDARLRQFTDREASIMLARDDALRRNQGWMVEAALRLGNFEQAASAAHQAIEKPIAGRLGPQGVKDSVARNRVRLGQALLGSGRTAEARAEFEQALAYYREQQKAGANGMGSRQDLARALYQLSQAQALDEAGVARRQALLAEAETVLLGMTFEAQQTLNGSELIQWVRKARAVAGG
jgi:tetratricopeptide (TPR) repeat protein